MIITTPANAACHVYSHWYYPWQQPCSQRDLYRVKQTVKQFGTKRELEITLPTLDFTVCPEGEERLRAIAFLRSISDDLAIDQH